MLTDFLKDYLSIIIFIIVALGLSVGFIILNFLLSPKKRDPEKLSAYECGFEAVDDSRMEFDVRFYLVAILFIIFDLEIAFLFPWAISLGKIGSLGFWSMMIFLFILTIGFIVLNYLFSPKKPDPEKLSAYECGFEAFSDSRMEFDVRFYLVAILFIIFDLEIAFLFPWAISLGNIGAWGFWSMMIFLFILTIGFIYEWKQGALDWA